MGFYINPLNESKQSFLDRVSTKIQQPLSYNDVSDDTAIICLVDNGVFSAAGIVFSERELKAFTYNVNDDRPKTWYIVPRNELYQVSEIRKTDFE